MVVRPDFPWEITFIGLERHQILGDREGFGQRVF